MNYLLKKKFFQSSLYFLYVLCGEEHVKSM
jgi:hypothetical protein